MKTIKSTAGARPTDKARGGGYLALAGHSFDPPEDPEYEDPPGLEPMNTRETCEWDPKSNAAALSESGCGNVATVSIGANGAWHVCSDCAKLPKFKRFKVRTKIGWPGRD